MKRKLSIRVIVPSLLILLFSRAVDSSRIAAWYDTNLRAPQLVYLSPDNIFYSLCNSSALPVFPHDASAKFNLTWTPDSSKSHLTGFGLQEDGVYYVAIFYQAFGDAALVGEVFRCEHDGYFSSEAVRSWNITDDVNMDGPVRGGLIYDSSGQRSIIHIGSDRDLHRYKEVDGNWQLSKQEGREYWPLSDYPKIGFGYAFDAASDQIWLYYFSNDIMIQAHQSGPGKWEEAVALPKTPPSPGPSKPGGGGAGGKRGVDEEDPDLYGDQSQYGPRSLGTQVGKGFGIAFIIGIPFAAVAAYALHRRYPLKAKATKGHAASELPEEARDFIYEMQDNEPSHEMYGDGQVHELPGSDVRELSAE